MPPSSPRKLQRLSARERSALDSQDLALLTRPISMDPRVLGAFTRKMVRQLRSRRSSSPSADAVLFITDVFERSVAVLTPAPAKAAIACSKGCAYCCAQPVTVTAMEVFALAALLRAREGAGASIAGTAEKIRGRSLQGAGVQCPLLVDKHCSVYETRPLACRAYVSFSVQDCITALVLRGKPSARCPDSYDEMRNACRAVMVAALKVCGMPSHLYEMNAALALAMAEDAETRWRQGEDIFGGLTPIPVDPGVETKIARFAENVALTL